MSNPAIPTPPWVLDGLAELQAAEAGHPEVVVAVIDGPVQIDHPAFTGARLTCLDPQAGQGLPHPASDHGTHIASVILSRPVGIAPGCAGLIIPVYQEDGAGQLVPCHQSDLAMAIDQAIDHGATLINISGGVLSPTGRADYLLEQAVQRAADRNVLIVAAVGNDGHDGGHVPASLPGVLAVGASDLNGAPLAFSNFGDAVRMQGIMAPGVAIPGAAPPDRLTVKTGTSFATPIVTAVAALLISRQIRQTGRADGQAVRQALLDSATGSRPGETVDARRILKGRLNVAAAHACIAGQRDGAAPSRSTPRKDVLMSDASPLPSLPALPPAGPHSAVAPSTAPVTPSEITVLPPVAVTTAMVTPSASAPSAAHDTPSVHTGQVPQHQAAQAVHHGAHAAHHEHRGKLVFALGTLGYDFGTEARMDYFIQQMDGAANILSPEKMATRLQAKEHGGEGRTEEAEALIWTLNIDGVPVYAIAPDSQFAVICYIRLVQFLYQQEKEKVERVSIAGRIRGTTRLYNGTVVPTISPTLRGMYNWSTADLSDAVLATMDKLNPDQEKHVREGIEQFLHRVYHEMRNPGLSPEHRAINFAATNAFHAGSMFKEMAAQEMVLDRMDVTKSPVSRPDSDCWDVNISFFNPTKLMEQARKVYRLTIDVSDEVPVTVGDPRSWFVYFGAQR